MLVKQILFLESMTS